MEIFQVLFNGHADMRGHAGVGSAGAHGVKRGCISEGKFVQMALEFAIASEAKSADDTNNRRGIRMETLRHGAHAQENVFARMLKDRPDDLLPLDTELLDALPQVRAGGPGRSL